MGGGPLFLLVGVTTYLVGLPLFILASYVVLRGNLPEADQSKILRNAVVPVLWGTILVGGVIPAVVSALGLIALETRTSWGDAVGAGTGWVFNSSPNWLVPVFVSFGYVVATSFVLWKVLASSWTRAVASHPDAKVLARKLSFRVVSISFPPSFLVSMLIWHDLFL